MTEREVGELTTSHATEEELTEFEEDSQSVREKAKEVAEKIKKAKHFVVYTGAGISTAANIPDYRGPKGLWTLKDSGVSIDEIKVEEALPTFSHFALSELIRKGFLKHIISTNIDGLHIRSGTSLEDISEIHGNKYKEYCDLCGKIYIRKYDTTKDVVKKSVHKTGRKCDECSNELKDSIIHFGESLWDDEIMEAVTNSMNADLALVLGTSMRVQPACDFPSMNCGKHKFGDLVIVNLQKTPYDKISNIRVFSKTDEFLFELMKHMELQDFNINTIDIVQNYSSRKKIKKSHDVPEMVPPEPYHFDQFEAVQMKKYESKGLILTLNGIGEADLKRTILKSDTCSLKIPEIELESPEGTPKFTTIQSLIDEIYDNLKKHSGGYVSNSNSKSVKETQKNPVLQVIENIEKILKGEESFTLELSDPLGISRIQLLKDDNQGKVFVERFERTEDMNLEYGIVDQ